jgi:hypothetical protein
MNWLRPHRVTQEKDWLALLEQGEKVGRTYAFFAARCGEGEDAIPATRIRVIDRREGTLFHATTPFICRGKTVDVFADFVDLELDRLVQPEELGVEREAIPPRPLCTVRGIA